MVCCSASKKLADNFLPLRSNTGLCLGGLRAPTLHLFTAETLLAPNEGPNRLIELGCSEVLTKKSAAFGRVEELFEKINFTRSKLGAAALMRDILEPPTTLSEIQSRREAIRELKENTELRSKLEECLGNLQKNFYGKTTLESTALRVLAPNLADTSSANLSFFGGIVEKSRTKLNQYYVVARRASSLGKLLRSFSNINAEPNSALLRELLRPIENALQSVDRELYDGKGLVRFDRLGKANPVDSRCNTPWYVPALSISKATFETTMLSLTAATLVPRITESVASSLFSKFYFQGIFPLCCLAVTMLSCVILNKKQEVQFQERLSKSSPLMAALDAIGELDAILSLVKYEEKLGAAGGLPTLLESDHFYASYKGARNPVLALQQPQACVPNDFEFRAGKLTALNGPNSGGKSTILRTFFYNQILAQLGTVVAAERASLSIADRIIYQGPEESSGKNQKQDGNKGHGQFFAEMIAVKEILDTGTRQSLIILDEVGAGSAEEESRKIVYDCLMAFKVAKGGVIYVTHDRTLVRNLAEDGATPIKMGFDPVRNKPTYTIEPGISSSSYANIAAHDAGITPEYLKQFALKRAD